MTSLSLVPVGPADLAFLRQMLHVAATWRDRDATTPPAAATEPALTRYLDGWGRPGDGGLVARVVPVRAGAVWVRRFRADEPGYGFVDESTPELSIAVAAAHRGRGIGRALLVAMLTALRLDGVHRVSLSVEVDNPARALYAGCGFVVWSQVDGALTMLRDLDA